MSNALQTLVDSKLGVVLATTMHTLGAIGMLGGLVGYVAWHRHLRRGHHHPTVLASATFMAYFSILVNLIGGFMRTYETGHPHITEFASSAWVRAISIKHVFIFAGMAASIVLFERVAPRHLKAHKAGTLADERMTANSLAVLTVVLGIVVSAILGAVSSILPVGAAAVDDDMGEPLVDEYQNATGQLLGTPLAQAVVTGDFTVSANRTDLAVLLTWTPTTSNVQLELLDPSGDVRMARSAATGTIDDALGAAPTPGRWTYRISSADAVVNAQWSLAIHLPASGTHDEHA